jgi:(2S)-methylsuccinyl-CoA dehydrogenase
MVTVTSKFIERLRNATASARAYRDSAIQAAARACCAAGRVDAQLLQRHQRTAHGMAWTAAIVEAIDRSSAWAERLAAAGRLGESEELALTVGIGEYLAQLQALPMSQSEIFRPAELGIEQQADELAGQSDVQALVNLGSSSETRLALLDRIRQGIAVAETALDEELDLIRSQFREFAAAEITPYAQRWHLDDELVPDALVGKLADLGVFGICVETEYGGLGLGKRAMCVVSEELSRAWIATGSLGTRSEIAAELISSAGTPEQKRYWLPKIASGEVLPTAVFTEPEAGSDLASIRTRATPHADGGWRIDGGKTWITHAARSDLMTLLARTEEGSFDHTGLSMFLAAKPRGTADDDFPAAGMSGGEIPVLGYRGMKEYDLAFDGFVVSEDALLGGQRGQGFRQLMQTFEAARIQTAARSVGVAWRAYDLALQFAIERKQFGQSIVQFPRVADKLAMMVAETVLSRELTYFAAEAKDGRRRCDLEAGMAKLLAGRVAWTNADAAVQIHGGNGYSLEFEISRVLCDARVLSLFEGTAEIQANVIARRLLSDHA